MRSDNPAPMPCADLAAVAPGAEGMFTAYAMLRSVRSGRTQQGKPFIDVEVADQSTTVGGKIWHEAHAAQEAARSIPPGRPVKLLFQAGQYQGAVQLDIKGMREVHAPDDVDYRPSTVYGEGIDLVADDLCETLVFDIETVPAYEKRELPSTVAESLVKLADHREMETGAVMGMSPFFGKVVSLAFCDGEAPPGQERLTALVVRPQTDTRPLPAAEGVRAVSEPDLLRAFWTLAGAARTVVSYNGRGFDVPFLVGRSLVHGIAARVDLLSNRFSLRPHLDLLQVVRQGSSVGPTTLDVVCWALGIESPKGQMDGSMVAPAYARGEIAEIARYNLADVRATAAVYRHVRDHLLVHRKDW